VVTNRLQGQRVLISPIVKNSKNISVQLKTTIIAKTAFIKKTLLFQGKEEFFDEFLLLYIS
jgi:hypothetical protein